jgi:hypothetical protein
MKNHSKVGKKPGRPTYRTQDSFKFRKYLKVKTLKIGLKAKKGNAQKRIQKNKKVF